MQYLLLIHHDERAWNELGETEQKNIYAEYRQLMEDMRAAGQLLSGSQLQPSASATTIRVRGGTRLVTDGPFAETLEQLGGYFVIDVRNLDEAIGLAGRVPPRASAPSKSGRCSRGQIWKVGVFPQSGARVSYLPLAPDCGKTPTFQI